MTPEFGPDGYQHVSPFRAAPAISLDDINRWMAERQRARFSGRAADHAVAHLPSR
jgi:hypothetical protein